MATGGNKIAIITNSKVSVSFEPADFQFFMAFFKSFLMDLRYSRFSFFDILAQLDSGARLEGAAWASAIAGAALVAAAKEFWPKNKIDMTVKSVSVLFMLK